MKKLSAVVLIAAMGLTSCSKDENEKAPQNLLTKGSLQPVNAGKGYTWIETTPDDRPVTVGIHLTAKDGARKDGGRL